LKKRIILLFIIFLLGFTLIFTPTNLNAENFDQTENGVGTALITDLDADGNLTDEHDYAGYGAVQLLTQIGAEYTVEPLSALEDKEILLNYQTVIMPSTIEDEDILDQVVEYVESGGIFISGGMDLTRDEPGVTLSANSQKQVPEIAANFTHNSEHPILENIHPDGMPVLIPHGMSSYPVLSASADAEGYGRVEFGNNVGDALIINKYGEGIFITYGVNPFATAGYGMGMVTELLEERYEFPTRPDENIKSFNWQTVDSIREEYISYDDVHLIWGEEYGNLIRQSLLWAHEKQDSPVIWQWHWPDLAPFAATIQHDRDFDVAETDADMAAFRAIEKNYGVKSALYVLVHHDTDFRFTQTDKTQKWYEEGWEIALHADRYPDPEDFEDKMRDDLDTISDAIGIPISEIRGVMHHFVRYYRDTPLWWESIGFEYDSTLYDMDWRQPFFTGTSMPFYLKHGTDILSVIELPSRTGDGEMTQPKSDPIPYMYGTDDMDQVKTNIEAYVSAVAEAYGHASWNAHPSHRRRASGRGEDMQTWFIEEAQRLDAWFPRPVDVAQRYRGISELELEITSWDGEELRLSISSADITAPLPLEDYSLLIPQSINGNAASEAVVDGAQVNINSFNVNGWDVAALVFDITGDHEVVVSY